MLSTIRDILYELELRFLAHESMLGAVKPARFASNLQITRSCMQWICDNLDGIENPLYSPQKHKILRSICVFYGKAMRIEELCSTSGVITEQAMQELVDADAEYRLLEL